MIRKCLYDGNDDDNDDGDDGKISFHKVFKGIMYEINRGEKGSGMFKNGFCCTLPCRNILFVSPTVFCLFDTNCVPFS